MLFPFTPAPTTLPRARRSVSIYFTLVIASVMGACGQAGDAGQEESSPGPIHGVVLAEGNPSSGSIDGATALIASGTTQVSQLSMASAASSSVYNAADVLDALKAAHGRYAGPAPSYLDANGSGTVTLEDAKIVLQRALTNSPKPQFTTAYFEVSVSGLGSSISSRFEGGSVSLKGNDGATYAVSGASAVLSVTSLNGTPATLQIERHPVNRICAINAVPTALGGRSSASLSCVHTPINDTGLTNCMPGVDCALQDAGSGRGAISARLGKINPSTPGAFDYTRICNNGAEEGSSGCPIDAVLGVGALQWGCTRDNVTGLVWLATDFEGRYQQQDINALMTNFEACGRPKGSWRIPSVDQLHSLIFSGGEKVNADTVAANLTWLPMLNYSRRNSRPGEVPKPAAVPEGSGFWTSTLAGAPAGVEAWSVLFEGGGRVYTVVSRFELRIVPVSTADLAGRFADSYHRSARWSADLSAGTLLDRRSGLMWQICSIGKTFNAGLGRCDPAPGQAADRSFRAALTDASAVNQDVTRNRGYTDWRLPNRAELASLVDCLRWRPTEAASPSASGVMPAGCTEPDLQRLVTLDSPASSYWSSSWLPAPAVQGASGEAFTVDFSSGMVGLEPDLDIPFRVRLVRNAR